MLLAKAPDWLLEKVENAPINIKNKKEVKADKYIDITEQIPNECADCMLASTKIMITEISKLQFKNHCLEREVERLKKIIDGKDE